MDTDQVQAEVERSRQIQAPEVAAPERVHDHRTPLERIAGGIGNRGFSQFVARLRDGEGILASGVVHPDVEAAIAAARGGGRPLDRSLSRNLGSSMGDSLSDVRVHTGSGAEALARAVSARAFTVGNDIFFGPGEYRPHSPEGSQLIAHEVAHVVQQRGAPLSGPLNVSQPGDALEREAEAVARDVSA